MDFVSILNILFLLLDKLEVLSQITSEGIVHFLGVLHFNFESIHAYLYINKNSNLK